jgi:Rod binding domain-containing protein
MAAQAGMQQAQESRLLQQVSSAKSANDTAKIEKGARQFESMLLSSWLQQAEKSYATVPGDDDDEDAAGRDQMMSMGVQSLADSLAASGGIGIAKMIVKAMENNANKAEAAPGGPAHEIHGGNLSFGLNSGSGSADSRPGSGKGSQ